MAASRGRFVTAAATASAVVGATLWNTSVDHLPLSIRLIDSETGAPIRPEGGHASVFPYSNNPRADFGEIAVPLATDGSGFQLEASPWRSGRWLDLNYTVGGVPGYVDRGLWDEFPIDGPIATATREIQLTIPMPPEARLVVELRNPRGDPVVGASISGVWVGDELSEGSGGAFSGPLTREETPGRIEVHGIPFVRNSRVKICAMRDRSSTVAEAMFGPSADRPCVVRATVDERVPGGPFWYVVGGGTGGRGGHSENHPSWTPDGISSTITVLDESGAPLPGARIELGWSVPTGPMRGLLNSIIVAKRPPGWEQYVDVDGGMQQVALRTDAAG